MSPSPSQLRQASLDHPGGTVQLVQITDCHLGKTPGSTLLGMDTDHSLQAVVDLVLSERRQTDLVLGTGDLSDHGAGPAYLRLRDYFDQVCKQNFWLPGNHDTWEDMWVGSEANPQMSNEIRVSNWQILMLNSQIPGEVGGELGSAQLELLEDCLARARTEGLHSMVCLHHQPVPIGSAWIDAQMVSDADKFFQVLQRYSGVKAVLWGHVHQQIVQQRGDLALLASPSTCVQFAPGLPGFKVDDKAPGYRWMDLHEDGSIDTGISRVEGVSFSVELDSGGYL